MKCLILAAGYATRLYPLTENFPKPLLKVGEKTILDWLVDDIETAGLVDEYVVISNHRFASFFDEWAAGRPEKITVVDDGTVSNETRLGAVRDIQFAIESLSLDDDMLVIAGDNVLDFSLTEFISYALRKNTSCVMRYYEPDAARLRKSGVACVDADDRIVSMEEKPAEPASNWCTPPFYFYRAEDVKKIHVSDAVKEYIVAIANATRESERIRLGVSPRGTLAMMKASQAFAAINGRDYVLPDDVKAIAVPVLSHRIISRSQNTVRLVESNENIIEYIMDKVPAPIAEN